MWHVTCDMWHVTRDTDTCLGAWAFSQNFSSLAPTVCDLWYFEDLEEKDDSVNESINDEGVYRTAPATPGLLTINKKNMYTQYVLTGWDMQEGRCLWSGPFPCQVC